LSEALAEALCLDVEYKKHDGTAIKAQLTSRPRFNDVGDVIGFEGIAQDITELRQLEGQLLHSQKMESIGTLAGGIAHDFNNLLGFARKGKTRIEDINAGAVVTEVEGLLRETIDRSIRLYTDIAPELWQIKGNPSQVHQILMNLCINAKDAILAGDGHELKISVPNTEIEQSFVTTHPDATCGSYVLIDVSDDGSGIPEKIKNQMFDPFFTTKDIGKGTGLGLATVYGIIKNHGGFLYLDSQEGVWNDLSCLFAR